MGNSSGVTNIVTRLIVLTNMLILFILINSKLVEKFTIYLVCPPSTVLGLTFFGVSVWMCFFLFEVGFW